jgi:ABC-type Na+ efflux pump permease subunit
MHKTLKIIRREYLEIVKKKSFIVGLFLVPAIIGCSLFIPILLLKVNVAEQKSVVVIDRTGGLFETFTEQMDQKLKDGRPEYVFSLVRDEQDSAATRESLVADVNKGVLNGYLIIPENIYEEGEAQYYSKSVSNVQ